DRRRGRRGRRTGQRGALRRAYFLARSVPSLPEGDPWSIHRLRVDARGAWKTGCARGVERRIRPDLPRFVGTMRRAGAVVPAGVPGASRPANGGSTQRRLDPLLSLTAPGPRVYSRVLKKLRGIRVPREGR